MKKIVILLAILAYSVFAHAGTYTTEYAWELDPVAYDNESGKTVIVRVYSNGKEICAAYDNMTADSMTTASCTFEHADGRADQVGMAEWSAGPVWSPDTQYELGDIVVSSTILAEGYVHYECTRAGTSDIATEPVWPTVNDSYVDDPNGTGVQWIAHNTTIPDWQAETAYGIGDKVLGVDYTLGGDQYLQCISGGTSGAVEPNWNAEVPSFWYHYLRFFFSERTINDPDLNGVIWETRRGTAGKESPAMSAVYDENQSDSQRRVGRSLN